MHGLKLYGIFQSLDSEETSEGYIKTWDVVACDVMTHDAFGTQGAQHQSSRRSKVTRCLCD